MEVELNQEPSLQFQELTSTLTRSGLKCYVPILSQRVYLGVVLW